MKISVQFVHCVPRKGSGSFARCPHPQRGVVLIISLILLVVISLLAVAGMRNAGSSESVLGNVRTTELATQAAEIALRHCESSVLRIQKNVQGDTTSAEATYPTTFTSTNILTATSPAHWQDTAGNWDVAPSSVYVIPMSFLNQTGMAIATYKRAPECMVEPLPVMLSNGTVVNTSSFVITARGFGPEVAAADGSRSRPVGSEVWLQSHIKLQ